MNTFSVTGIRSVAIGVPDLAAAARFYAETWGLAVVDRSGDAVYLRATGPAHHVLALHRTAEPCVRSIDFHAASITALEPLASRVVADGGVIFVRSDSTKPSVASRKRTCKRSRRAGRATRCSSMASSTR